MLVALGRLTTHRGNLFSLSRRYKKDDDGLEEEKKSGGLQGEFRGHEVVVVKRGVVYKLYKVTSCEQKINNNSMMMMMIYFTFCFLNI